ncbi:MAG: hypothetical protein PHE36_09350 [Novosphingobium sp.]|nr:hypothetical protein [Novosphingobium sp.]
MAGIVKVVTIDDFCLVAEEISYWERHFRGPDPRQQYVPERVMIHMKSGCAVTIECESAQMVSDQLLEFMLKG